MRYGSDAELLHLAVKANDLLLQSFDRVECSAQFCLPTGEGRVRLVALRLQALAATGAPALIVERLQRRPDDVATDSSHCWISCC